MSILQRYVQMWDQSWLILGNVNSFKIELFFMIFQWVHQRSDLIPFVVERQHAFMPMTSLRCESRGTDSILRNVSWYADAISSWHEKSQLVCVLSFRQYSIGHWSLWLLVDEPLKIDGRFWGTVVFRIFWVNSWLRISFHRGEEKMSIEGLQTVWFRIFSIAVEQERTKLLSY